MSSKPAWLLDKNTAKHLTNANHCPTPSKQIQTVSPVLLARHSNHGDYTTLCTEMRCYLTRMDSLCVAYNLVNACCMCSRKTVVQVYLWKLKGRFYLCV